jgi:hypothetical protein
MRRTYEDLGFQVQGKRPAVDAPLGRGVRPLRGASSTLIGVLDVIIIVAPLDDARSSPSNTF